MDKVIKTDEEWSKILTPEQFNILRKKGTERVFSGSLLNNKEKGIYRCVACMNPLFSSDAKYDSGTGWPSFFEPLSGGVIIKPYYNEGENGAEVLCRKCDGHLGHIFHDGPMPTGKRYCMNSAVLKFEKV